MTSWREELIGELTPLGLQASFVDAFGVERVVTDELLRRLRDQFGGAPRPTPRTVPLVGAPDWGHPELVGRLVCETGEVWELDGWLPPEVPYGYHRLTGALATDRLVVVAPREFPQPRRGFGLAVQLYAARSQTSWGIGDLADLTWLARRTAAAGGSAVLVSPLHAARPSRHQNPSPYSPASRLFLNVLHIALPEVPDAGLVDLSDLADAGEDLNDTDLIDRDAAFALKLAGLERIWAAIAGRPGAEFEAYLTEQGRTLADFATWSALSEEYAGAWWDWPAGYRRPDTAEVADYAADHADRVRFWSWCQWVADRQLARACAQGADVVLDLAVGFDAGGADGWMFQDLVAFGFEIGCPSDHGNPGGQRWGVTPFDPARLAAAEYAPMIALVRAGLRHAKALRVDHVMGLWRLFWIPVGGSASDGGYVRYHGDALLGIMRLEAHRAGAWVVGEDMGTLEDRALEVMAATGTLSYRVSTRTHPDEFPERAMVACETHDQPTIAGLLDGSDLATCLRIGKRVDPEAVAALRARIAALAGIDGGRPVTRLQIEQAVTAMYAELAGSRARLALATLDDLAGVSARPNIPGTVDENPNWRRPLPMPIHDLFERVLARRVLCVLAAARTERPEPGPADPERCLAA
ncbi:4-alpha-glucanotransferase [Jidongwangia harbinensis]|uniref:4-alpha-glucanotransferase n=1 Tax=Jidongwangia harbinensis TaxID=2878561 RepID=UPI001CD99A40|nr:4-alpha-glucanotransferase [Jidongwangia harbinensis]MCA2218326.1 4-alpha-glucanotransferase [Jidongwangia harbinensis]